MQLNQDSITIRKRVSVNHLIGVDANQMETTLKP